MDKKVFLKPCPFCNGNVKVTSDRDFFEAQVAKTGSFCIHIECFNCNLEMWEQNATDWDEAVKSLAWKWNIRGGEDEE